MRLFTVFGGALMLPGGGIKGNWEVLYIEPVGLESSISVLSQD